MKDEIPLHAEDYWPDEIDVDLDDDFEPEELEADEDCPLMEEVRRSLSEH